MMRQVQPTGVTEWLLPSSGSTVRTYTCRQVHDRLLLDEIRLSQSSEHQAQNLAEHALAECLHGTQLGVNVVARGQLG